MISNTWKEHFANIIVNSDGNVIYLNEEEYFIGDEYLEPWFMNRVVDAGRAFAKKQKEDAKEREKRNLLRRTIERQQRLVDLIYQYKSLKRRYKNEHDKEISGIIGSKDK